MWWMRPLPRLARTADDLDWFVPHQANARIIDASAEKLRIAPQKVVKTVDLSRQYVGGIRAARAERARDDGRIKRAIS